jgi:predicted amidohydrolase YtcJ
MAVSGEADEVVDLGGRTLLPGFIDCHCHILPTGLNLQALDLSPFTSRDEVLDALSLRDKELEPGKWLRATQYNQNRFADGVHLDRFALDAVSSSRPILLSHVSGHASVANSVALSLAGVSEDQPNPKGGEFVRDASGRLTGVMLEYACDKVAHALPLPSVEEMTDAILRASSHMASLGITCASDMMTGYYSLERELEAYRLASERGASVRFRLFVQWSSLFGRRALATSRFEELCAAMNPARCRVAGAKMFVDGALSSRTAAVYGAFEGCEPEHEGWSGQLVYKPVRLREMLEKAMGAGYLVAVHTLGDYATDQVLGCLEKFGGKPLARLEHVMMLSDEQILRIAALGVGCTIQPEFLLRFGEAYRRSIGLSLASRLNRIRSLMSAGVPIGFSSDRPVVGGNPWDGIDVAVNRVQGFDSSENISREEALLAYTAGAADANGDGGQLGRLEPGEWADYQVVE